MPQFGIFPAVAAALALASAPAPAPTEPLDYLPALTGEYFPLKSSATGTTYHIYIRYPQGYADTPDSRYPIVYVLDGDSLFPLLSAQHVFLTIDDKIPEAIIVGIAYGSFDPKVNHRDTDFGTGAQAFQQFLSSELIPQVEMRVRADSARRILVGQSYGGRFVLYSAIAKPDEFWARIASNPSFRLSGQEMWEDASPAQRRDLHVYVVNGSENHREARETAMNWVLWWNDLEPSWTVEEIEIEGGTHSADIGNAYRAALRKLFAPGPEAR